MSEQTLEEKVHALSAKEILQLQNRMAYAYFSDQSFIEQEERERKQDLYTFFEHQGRLIDRLHKKE